MVRGIFALISMTGIPRLIMRLMMDKRVPFWQKLFLPLAALYIISPWDIVPDFLLFLGRIDDVIALVAAGLAMLLLAPRDVLMELAGSPASRGAGGGANGPASNGKKTIDGEYRVLDE